MYKIKDTTSLTESATGKLFVLLLNLVFCHYEKPTETESLGPSIAISILPGSSTPRFVYLQL